jgi:hypothetical protein
LVPFLAGSSRGSKQLQQKCGRKPERRKSKSPELIYHLFSPVLNSESYTINLRSCVDREGENLLPGR